MLFALTLVKKPVEYKTIQWNNFRKGIFDFFFLLDEERARGHCVFLST